MSLLKTKVFFCIVTLFALIRAQAPEIIHSFDFTNTNGWTFSDVNIAGWGDCPTGGQCWRLDGGGGFATATYSTFGYHNITVIIDLTTDLGTTEYCSMFYSPNGTAWTAYQTIISQVGIATPETFLNITNTLPPSVDNQNNFELHFENSGGHQQNDNCYWDNMYIWGIPYTSSPTSMPITTQPTLMPVTIQPSLMPTTFQPTSNPVTSQPTLNPVTSDPTTSTPTTFQPTLVPSNIPSSAPSDVPTSNPTTKNPTVPPGSPSRAPSPNPTEEPTIGQPSLQPSIEPTLEPIYFNETMETTSFIEISTESATVQPIDSDDDSQGKSSIEQLIADYGLYAGIGLGVLLIILLIICCCCYSKRKNKAQAHLVDTLEQEEDDKNASTKNTNSGEPKTTDNDQQDLAFLAMVPVKSTSNVLPATTDPQTPSDPDPKPSTPDQVDAQNRVKDFDVGNNTKYDRKSIQENVKNTNALPADFWNEESDSDNPDHVMKRWGSGDSNVVDDQAKRPVAVVPPPQQPPPPQQQQQQATQPNSPPLLGDIFGKRDVNQDDSDSDSMMKKQLLFTLDDEDQKVTPQGPDPVIQDPNEPTPPAPAPPMQMDNVDNVDNVDDVDNDDDIDYNDSDDDVLMDVNQKPTASGPTPPAPKPPQQPDDNGDDYDNFMNDKDQGDDKGDDYENFMNDDDDDDDDNSDNDVILDMDDDEKADQFLTPQ